jgi:hypothetical protein
MDENGLKRQEKFLSRELVEQPQKRRPSHCRCSFPAQKPRALKTRLGVFSRWSLPSDLHAAKT